jgi:hypothetical protein
MYSIVWTQSSDGNGQGVLLASSDPLSVFTQIWSPFVVNIRILSIMEICTWNLFRHEGKKLNYRSTKKFGRNRSTSPALRQIQKVIQLSV